MNNKLKCHACKQVYNYTPKEYGGYCPEVQGNVCKKCWDEYMEIRNRQNKEITEWLNSK